MGFGVKSHILFQLGELGSKQGWPCLHIREQRHVAIALYLLGKQHESSFIVKNKTCNTLKCEHIISRSQIYKHDFEVKKFKISRDFWQNSQKLTEIVRLPLNFIC